MNLNKDYIITVDVKNAAVSTPSNMSFYITDVKTSNIFAKLVINESKSELIKKYAPVENAEDFEITLRVIKPNNEFKELKFTLLNQLEAFFMVNLTDEFKDYIGTYKCEFFVDSKVNNELERITTSSFSYNVLASIANSLDDVIEDDPDYPLVDEILDRLEAMDPAVYATTEYVDEAVDGVALEADIPGIINSYLTGYRDNIALAAPFKMMGKTNVPLDARTVVDTESDIMNIEYPYVGMIVYVKDTGKRYEVLTLAPKQVGLAAVQDVCVGTYRELDYATTEYVDNAVSNAGGGSGGNVDLSAYAPIDSPNFTTAISMGRKEGSEIGTKSTALGNNVIASGRHSHAEGSNTTAEGWYSHAEGYYTTASGHSSHSEGLYTLASSRHQHVQGKYNIEDMADTYVHIVGNGTSQLITDRSNAHTLDWEGNAWYQGDVFVGGTSQDDASKLATTDYVDSAVANAGGGSGNVDLTGYAPIDNPNFTTAVSMGRREGAYVGTNSTALGYNVEASGDYSHAEGYHTTATNSYSHAEGFYAKTDGFCSHVEGWGTRAPGECQHVQGKNNIEDFENKYAHIVGNGADEGNRSNAHTLDWEGRAWFAEGVYVGGLSQDDGSKLATEDYVIECMLHAGDGNIVLDEYATKEYVGEQIDKTIDYVDEAVKNAGGGDIDTENLVIGNSLTVGKRTELYGKAGGNSCAIGNNCANLGDYSVAKGEGTYAEGVGSSAEGNHTETLGDYSHAEGYRTIAAGEYQHVQGKKNIPDKDGRYAHIVGNGDEGRESNAHTLDWDGNAWFKCDVFVGGESQDDSKKLATEDYVNEAIGNIEITGGGGGSVDTTNLAISNSLTVGDGCSASGKYSVAKGSGTNASGQNSSAEGGWTTAYGSESHAEGSETFASGTGSHAEGKNTTAASQYQHVQGKYNIEDSKNKYAHIVGNGDYKELDGEWQTVFSNAHTLDWSGNGWFAGDVYVGGTSQDNGSKLATEDYVNNHASGLDLQYNIIEEVPNTVYSSIDTKGIAIKNTTSNSSISMEVGPSNSLVIQANIYGDSKRTIYDSTQSGVTVYDNGATTSWQPESGYCPNGYFYWEGTDLCFIDPYGNEYRVTLEPK